ncbi:MAG: ABC transporter substrate-binding protein [Oscillospiraceae bacterium]|nr:ABC transporter substrate-binding protein [Oscillospiraceae bacterium]
MKIRKMLALVLALMLAVSLFAGCGSSSTTTTDTGSDTTATSDAATTGDEAEAPADTDAGETEEVTVKGTVKIGHLLDLTGTEAATGNQGQTAFNFAAERIGLCGGYEIEVVEQDCQSNSSMAAQAAATLVETEGVVAIFGPTQIGHKSAVASYLQDNGVPLILYNGTPSGMLASSDWAVGMGGSTSQFPTVAAYYAYNELGWRNVYTVRQQTTGGDNYVGPFEEIFTALGGNIIQSVELPVSGSDYSSLLATFTDESADGIAGWTSSADAINFWSSWYELGLADRLPIMATMHGGFTDFYIMNQLNNSNPEIVNAILANQTVSVISYCYSIESDENAALVAAWEEEFGSVPGGNNLAGACWQALQIFQAAMDATDGDTDPDTLLEALLAVDVNGPEGHTFFGEGNNAATKNVYVVQVVQLEDGTYNYQVVKTYEDVGPEGYSE